MFGITGKTWPVQLLLLVIVLGCLVAFAVGVKNGWNAMAAQELEHQKAAKAQAAPVTLPDALSR